LCRKTNLSFFSENEEKRLSTFCGPNGKTFRIKAGGTFTIMLDKVRPLQHIGCLFQHLKTAQRIHCTTL